MSTALKERLARSRRRRSSFQSPIGGGDAKKARPSAADSHTERSSPSAAVLAAPAAAAAAEGDLPTPCRPKTLNRRQFITSSSSHTSAAVGSLSSLDSAFRASLSPPAANDVGSLANVSHASSGTRLASLDVDSGVELSSSGRAEDSPCFGAPSPARTAACTASDSLSSSSSAGRLSRDDDVVVSSGDVIMLQPCSCSIPSPPCTPVVHAAPPPAAVAFVLYDTPPVSARAGSGMRGDAARAELDVPEDDSMRGEATCAERDALAGQLRAHEEQLRKLNLVRLYRSKHNPEQLRELIGKWRQAGQDALLDLHALLPEPRVGMGEFLDHMKIDTKLMKYDAEEEAFQT